MKTTAHHIASRLCPFALGLSLLLITIGMGFDLKAQESDGTSITSKNIGEETIVMHRIDNKTTADELSTIATQAAEVGVNFSYNTNRLTGRLKNVQARIKRSEKNGKYCWQAYVKHDMDLSIGWVVDAEGDAVRLIDGNQEIVGLMECKAICDDVSEGEIPRIADIDQSLMAQNQMGLTDTKSTYSGLSGVSDTVIVRFEKGMTLQDYTAIESVIRQAGIEHEFSERSHLRTKVDLMVRLANSTQRHQLKLNQGADWHIDVAWRKDTEGRAIEFIDLADEE